MAIVKSIVEHRNEQKHTQRAVADHIGMPLSTYSLKEGQGGFTKKQIEGIAAFLKIAVNEIHVPLPEEQDIKIPDAIRYLSERVTMIEAGMEVERSLLIDLLANATGKTSTEISTDVAKALDYQISKRKTELKSKELS